MNDGKGMQEYRVTVFLKDKVVFTKDVRSKDRGRAVSNVLTNLYREDLDNVKVISLPITNKWECYRGCVWENHTEETPKKCPECWAKDIHPYKED